jgi:hypothetical protein
LALPLASLVLIVLSLLLLQLLAKLAIVSNLGSILDEDKWYQTHQSAKNAEQSTCPADRRIKG